jgi:hypothetical protein
MFQQFAKWRTSISLERIIHRFEPSGASPFASDSFNTEPSALRSFRAFATTSSGL